MKERFKYDPWGRPREYMEWLTLSDTTWHSMERHLQATNKGFTGHEMLDEVGIIHMGGRIYEPTIGRFLSADPVVKGLHNPESYNRYSYVLNSPLSFTDPSGYSWWSENAIDKWRELKTDVFRAALVFINPTLAFYEASFRYGGRELARFAAKNEFAGAVVGLVGIAGCSAASGGSATASCVASYQGITTAAIIHANGGSIGKALVAGIESAALAYTNAKIAGAIGDVGAGPIASGVMHGMRGAGFAAIGGGDLRSGLIGGFTEGALGGYIQKWMPNNRTGGTVTAAFVSGSVSEVTGGKFATGAVTGAMGYLFNTAAHGGQSISPQAVNSGFPSLPQGVVDFSAGLGDALLFGFGDDLRTMFSIDGGMNSSSGEYLAGGVTSFAAGGARLLYAGGAKIVSMGGRYVGGVSGAQFAVNTRNSFKVFFRGGLFRTIEGILPPMSLGSMA